MSKDPSKAFLKLYRISDKQSSTVIDVVQFPTADGKVDTIELPPSIVAKPQILLSTLLDHNAALPADASARKDIAHKLAAETPNRFLIRAASTGWVNGTSTYVLANDALGKDGHKYAGGPIFPNEFRLRTVGDLETWKKTASKLALLSSPWVCAMCTPFAAPLLKFSGVDPFTLCLSGTTHSGKSLGTLLAGSVIGFGEKDQLPTWQISKARLQERLPAYNDSMFALDDLENSDGGEKDQYLRVRALAYKIANGSGMERSKTYDKAHNLTHEKWRVIALTSAEITIARKASYSGEKRKNGEALRLIDLPVISDRTGDIFDRVGSDQNRLAWAQKQFGKVVKACKENHGTAQRAYIAAIIQLGNKLEPTIKAHIEEFLALVNDECTTSQANALARRFGLLFAGGAMAIKFKLVAWTMPELEQAISCCFSRARNLLQDEDSVLRDGRVLLAKWLTDTSSKLNKGESDKSLAARLVGMGDVFLIPRITFNGIFHSRTQKTAVENWLLQNRYLTRGNHQDAQEQHIWPDGERRRSVRLNWPEASRSKINRE